MVMACEVKGERLNTGWHASRIRLHFRRQQSRIALTSLTPVIPDETAQKIENSEAKLQCSCDRNDVIFFHQCLHSMGGFAVRIPLTNRMNGRKLAP